MNVLDQMTVPSYVITQSEVTFAIAEQGLSWTQPISTIASVSVQGG